MSMSAFSPLGVRDGFRSVAGCWNNVVSTPNCRRKLGNQTKRIESVKFLLPAWYICESALLANNVVGTLLTDRHGVALCK